MKRKIIKLLSVILICIITISTAVINTKAEVNNSTEIIKTVNYTYEKVKLDENSYNLFITNNQTGQVDVLNVTPNSSGTYDTKGWLSVADVNHFEDNEADFQTYIFNGEVNYKESSKEAEILGVVDKRKIDNDGGYCSPMARVSFPTGWYASSQRRSSIHTDVSNVATVFSKLLTLCGCEAQAKMVDCAEIIVKWAVPEIFYIETRYCRALEPCIQEYYYRTDIYNGSYTECIGGGDSITETVNLC